MTERFAGSSTSPDSSSSLDWFASTNGREPTSTEAFSVTIQAKKRSRPLSFQHERATKRPFVDGNWTGPLRLLVFEPSALALTH